MIPIVLTGCVIPNTLLKTEVSIGDRIEQYKSAIKFYSKKSKVYFLDNSSMSESNLKNNFNMPGVEIFKYSPSKAKDKGKGFQEFEMLDQFVLSELREDYFLKITGRYKIENLSLVLQKLNENTAYFDLKARRKICLTSYFFCSKAFYQNNILDLYKKMDDPSGLWAEKVLYEKLKDSQKYEFFNTYCIINAISGSTGKKYATNRSRILLSNLQRNLFRVMGFKTLYY